MVINHTQTATVLFTSDILGYEILIPKAEQALKLGTFVEFDAVFFNEQRYKSGVSEGEPYYRVLRVKTIEGPALVPTCIVGPEMFPSLKVPQVCDVR